MSLAEALATTLTERLRRDDLSAWQKAAELAEYQAYLRANGQPHSTRNLSRLVGVPQTRVSELLVIALELTTDVLARFGIQPSELDDVEHRALLRIAKMPMYLRDKPLRDCVRKPEGVATRSGQTTAAARERRRAYIYAKLREEGQLVIDIPEPIVTLSPVQARGYLDEFLPALAHLAELVKGPNRSHYIGLAGNGGLIIYLSPAS